MEKKEKRETKKATVANKIAHKNNNVSQMFLAVPEGGLASSADFRKI